MHRLTAPLALAAVLALAGCAGTAPAEAGAPRPFPSASLSSAPSAAPPAAPAPAVRTLAVEVRGGQATGDTGRVLVAVGEEVVLTVTSDAADDLHVHGYDRSADLAPGVPAAVRFIADVPGVFEVELHEAGTVLLSLQVG